MNTQKDTFLTIDSLIENVAKAWASIDGELETYEKSKSDPSLDMTEGTYSGYRAEAKELLKRSGLETLAGQLEVDNGLTEWHVRHDDEVWASRDGKDVWVANCSNPALAKQIVDSNNQLVNIHLNLFRNQVIEEVASSLEEQGNPNGKVKLEQITKTIRALTTQTGGQDE